MKSSALGANGERGAVAVEFALGAVLMLTILFALIAFGSMYSRIEVFQSAAREGARTAAVGGDQVAVTQAINEAADPYTIAPLSGISVSVEGESGSCDGDVGEAVTVSWSQSFDLDLVFLQLTTPTQTFKGVFRCEA